MEQCHHRRTTSSQCCRRGLPCESRQAECLWLRTRAAICTAAASSWAIGTHLLEIKCLTTRNRKTPLLYLQKLTNRGFTLMAKFHKGPYQIREMGMPTARLMTSLWEVAILALGMSTIKPCRVKIKKVRLQIPAQRRYCCTKIYMTPLGIKWTKQL